MPKRPNIHGLKLQSCCKKTLYEIDQTIKMGKLLKAFLPISPFITMLGANPVAILYTIRQTDWDALVKATNSVPANFKHACELMAFMEYERHPIGDLNRFWDAMYAVF